MKIANLIGIMLSALALAAAPALAADAAPAATDAWWQSAWDYLSKPMAIAWVVGLLMAVLPQGEPGTFWGFVRKILDFVANNWGKAANKPAA